MLVKRKKLYPTPAFKKATKYKKVFKKQSLSYAQNERIHFVKRHSDYLQVPVSNITGASGAFVFTLSNVPGYTELTALYDQYKICGVYLKFYTKQTQASNLILADTAKVNTRFLTCIDYNDNTPPANADEVRQYESCQVTAIHEDHEVYVKAPKFLNTSGQTVSDWMSTSSPATRWYGLKYWCDPTGNSGAGSQFNYEVEAIFYLCFKNIK